MDVLPRTKTNPSPMKTNRIFFSVVAGLLLLPPDISQASIGTNTDLAIGKTASTNAAKVGDVLSFQLSVTNFGPLPATAAVVADVLPSGLKYLSSAGPGTYNPVTGQWNFVPGNPGSISILTITIQATNAGVWLNSAVITVATPGDTNFVNNSASASVTVSSVTNPPIVLNCPSNITVTATGPDGASAYYFATASGGGGPLTVVLNPPTASTFPAGTTPVTVTARDSCGNSTNCSFTVTVVKPPISINCSSNWTVTATSSNGMAVFFTVTATGGCNPPPFVTASPPSGSTFPVGTTTVTATASDTCGTLTNCTFTVTVNPPVYPPIVLNCPSNLAVTATGPSGASAYYFATASGGCGPLTIVLNPPTASMFAAGTTPVTVTASDSCGNSTNCSFTVTVVKPPISINCSSNRTVTATSSSGVNVYYTVTATGGCSPPPFLTAHPPRVSTFPFAGTA